MCQCKQSDPSEGCAECQGKKQIPHKHAALIKAWADGASIQCRSGNGGVWQDVEEPVWNRTCQYRIKPEPKPDIVRYARAAFSEHPRGLESVVETTTTYWTVAKSGSDNIKAIWDGETGKLKEVSIV